VVCDEDGIKAFCRFAGIDGARDADVLRLQGRIVRVLETNGSVVKVSTPDGSTASLPVQALGPCTACEILRNIAWRSGDIPEPSDFPECVAAKDTYSDPGADPEIPSEAIDVSPVPGVVGTRVCRMRSTPAVGWHGIHASVTRQVLRLGKTMDLPPDGALVRVRLLEALEVHDVGLGDCDERRLVEGLPREATLRLGDGEVCDALECAIPRMSAGEIAAINCVDDCLVQPGGQFGFAAPRSASSVAAESDNGPLPYRARILLELVDVMGDDPLKWTGQDERRLVHAADRKEAGTKAFRSGRIRLARERYRRAANFLSVGLGIPEPLQGSYLGPNQPMARAIRTSCWLNLAQCELSLQNYEAAWRYADAVISENPENMKARFRRASARLAFGHPGEEEKLQATDDLKRVLQKDPNNAQANELMQKATQW